MVTVGNSSKTQGAMDLSPDDVVDECNEPGQH